MNDLEQILIWADDIYHFAMLVMDQMKQPRDYGTGEILNMVEMHTLSMIASHPGMCVSDVARSWNRTLGAASRNVDRLLAKGYIEKKKLDGNSKTIHLYVTESGQHLSNLHREYDMQQTRRFSEFIAQKYSMEDLKIFNSVLHSLQDFYENEPDKTSEK